MATTEKIHVLTVDDDPDFLKILGKLIQREFPSDVDEALDCASARTAFWASEYDLFTLDYQLPDGDGLELLGEIMTRNHDPLAIVVTGQGDENVATRAFQLGAVGYVVKDDRLAAMFADTIRRTVAMQRAKRSLRDSEIRYRRLFEAAKDGILILDAETGKIVDANPFLLEMLGYSLGELLGEELWEIGPFRDSVDTRGVVLEVQQKSYIRYDDLPLETKDGRTLDVEFVCNLYASGAADVIQCNIRDIRKRKHRESMEKLKTDDLDRYARSVSHDLKSPISAIYMATGLLEDRLRNLLGDNIDEVAVELTDLIKSSIEKASHLISDLLSLAEVGMVPNNVESVDVKAVIDDVLQEYKAVLAEECVVIRVDDDMGCLVGNPTQVFQVFANLIGNALEYARNERLVVEVSYLGRDEVGVHRYLVRDNGQGIPENMLDRLFLPFVSGKAGGGGVGLAIVHAIVRTYGGSIRGYNDENGACFEFTLKDFSGKADDN